MAGKGHKLWKWLGIILGTVLGLVLVLLVVLKIVLTPAVLTSMVNRFAGEYVDGDLSFGRIEASVFRHFPSVTLSLDDALLTYPHDRYERYDSLFIQSRYRSRGRGESVDTLASFSNFSASVNLAALLGGRIHIQDVSLRGARIFAHQYGDEGANWNIFRSGAESSPDDTSSTSLPHIIVHNLSLSENPRVVYTDAADTLFASIRMKEGRFHGRVDIAEPERHSIDLRIDSMFLSGRLPADTMALRVDRLALVQQDDEYRIDLASKAFLRMKSIGRMTLPVEVKGVVSLPGQNFNAVSLRNLDARVATVTLRGDAAMEMRQDSTYLQAALTIDTCSVDKTIKYFSRNLSPAVTKLRTDAVITLTAMCDGWYVPSQNVLPELVAELVVPKAAVSYDGIEYKGCLAADVNAMTDRWGKLNISLDELEVDIKGASLSGTGSVDDLLCDDPLIQLDVMADADLGDLGYILPEGIEAEGALNAAVSGMILLSDLSLYNFSKADLEGFMDSDGISILDRPDSLMAYLGKTAITMDRKGEGAALGDDKLSFKGQIDSLYAVYKDDTVIKGSAVKLFAQNADNVLSEQFGVEIHPIAGSLSAGNITMTGEDSLFVSVRGTTNKFKYSNRMDGGKTLPVLSLSSSNRGIFVRSGVNRIGLNGVNINGSAYKRGSERNGRRARLLDSLQRVYPGVDRDSLLRHHFSSRRNSGPVPDYLSEADFREKDIHIDLGETVSSYFREWIMAGALKVGRGSLTTPYFPLRNRISALEGHFDNDNLYLDGFTLRSGASDVSAQGKVTGLRRAVSGRGDLNLDLAITSKHLDANELLSAYDAGTRYTPPSHKDVTTLTDDQYMEQILSEAAADSAGKALIVVPANVNATLSIQGDGIKYSDLDISWFASDIVMKQRTLQVTNTVAASNMGDIYFEGFYSTRTKKDISAGFDLNLVDITADKVITLIPAVDSILPMLKTFKGMLDCEIAATSKLDTAMNFLPPTINGVLSIKGSNLSIHDDEGAFRKLASILMFKDKSIGEIQDMSVQGLIYDNTLAIFPFVVGVDRYSLALSGLQNFDKSFDYHVSVLKSPLPFKLGVDLWGNFDNWKWKLVKPRYRDANVPVYTREMSDMQMNLVSSIHNIFNRGVEEAVRANEATGGRLSGSSRGVMTSGSEQLDAAEAGQLDSLRYAYDHPAEATASPDSLLNDRIDALMDSMRTAPAPEKEECWLKRLFHCKKKDAARKEEN